jgi:hypothetical protein
MTQDAWPSPDAHSGPLPRIEDLPIAEQGYEQEAVRLAFDSFYRHAAQLDASLRALEAVEVFRQDADALRNDLRALRELGLGGSREPAWPELRYERPPREVPGTVFRLAGEAALIVAVAVIAAVAHFRPLVVVALMAAAFVIVAFAEWLASRSRFVTPPVGFMPEASPAAAEPTADVWAAPVRADEAAGLREPEPDELTMVGEAGAPAIAEAAPEAEKPEPEEAEQEQEPEPVAEAEPEPAEEEPEAESEPEPEPEALADDEDFDEAEPDEPVIDPWEQQPELDLDGDVASDEPALVERGGRFRRRRR